MEQIGLLLPTRDYYLDDLDQFVSIREAYVTYGTRISELFGANPVTAEADMKRILQLETDLANVSHYDNSCVDVLINTVLSKVKRSI